jgi:hypothetical protein
MPDARVELRAGLPQCGYPVAMRSSVAKRAGVFFGVSFAVAGAVLAVIAALGRT